MAKRLGWVSLAFLAGLLSMVLLNWVSPGLPVFQTAFPDPLVTGLVVLLVMGALGVAAAYLTRGERLFTTAIALSVVTLYVGAIAGGAAMTFIALSRPVPGPQSESGGFMTFPAGVFGVGYMRSMYESEWLTAATLGLLPFQDNDQGFPDANFWQEPTDWALVGYGFGMLGAGLVLRRKRDSSLV